MIPKLGILACCGSNITHLRGQFTGVVHSTCLLLFFTLTESQSFTRGLIHFLEALCGDFITSRFFSEHRSGLPTQFEIVRGRLWNAHSFCLHSHFLRTESWQEATLEVRKLILGAGFGSVIGCKWPNEVVFTETRNIFNKNVSLRALVCQ